MLVFLAKYRQKLMVYASSDNTPTCLHLLQTLCTVDVSVLLKDTHFVYTLLQIEINLLWLRCTLRLLLYCKFRCMDEVRIDTVTGSSAKIQFLSPLFPA